MLVSIIAPTAAESRTHRVRFIAAAVSIMVSSFALEKRFRRGIAGGGGIFPFSRGE
jgi:hypothetical protein